MFLQIQLHIHSLAANRIYQRTSCAVLQERIQQNRRDLDSTYRELLKTHLLLANQLSETDWSLIDLLTLDKATNVGENSKNRQLKKFTNLYNKQHPATKTMKDTVVNLSDQQLDKALHSLLQKGLNYAVTPKATPIEDILTGVEKANQSLPAEEAEEARQETVRILKNTKRPVFYHCLRRWNR